MVSNNDEDSELTAMNIYEQLTELERELLHSIRQFENQTGMNIDQLAVGHELYRDGCRNQDANAINIKLIPKIMWSGSKVS